MQYEKVPRKMPSVHCVTRSLEKLTMMRGENCIDARVSVISRMANTMDTTVMMEAAMPARMTWATCGSACEGNRTVGTHALAAGNSSSNHDRNAPAQPSASAIVSGRTKKPPRRLYVAWRSINGRLFFTALSVQVWWIGPTRTKQKGETGSVSIQEDLPEDLPGSGEERDRRFRRKNPDARPVKPFWIPRHHDVATGGTGCGSRDRIFEIQRGQFQSLSNYGSVHRSYAENPKKSGDDTLRFWAAPFLADQVVNRGYRMIVRNAPGSAPVEFEDRNLRRRADADGHADGANTPVDVKLAAGFSEQSGHVGSHQAAGRNLRADELERGLAAVRVPSQAQVDAEFCRAVEGVGIVAEQNVDAVRVDQRVNALKETPHDALASRPHGPLAGVVDSHQVERFALGGDRDALVAQDPYAGLPKQQRDGIFNPGPRIVIAQAAKYAERRRQAGKRLDDGLLGRRIPSDKIARQHGEIGLERVGDCHVFPDLVLRHERPDVNIGKLRDPEALECPGEARLMDGLAGDFQVEPPQEQPIGSGGERRGGYRVRRASQKDAPRRRVDLRRPSSSRQFPRGPNWRLDDGYANPEEHQNEKGDQGTRDPPGERRAQQDFAGRQVDWGMPAVQPSHVEGQHEKIHSQRRPAHRQARGCFPEGFPDPDARPPEPVELAHAENRQDDAED